MTSLRICYPKNESDWHSDNPSEWIEKNILVDKPLLWIEPFTWGDKVGNRIYFLDGTASINHFAIGSITFNVPGEIDSREINAMNLGEKLVCEKCKGSTFTAYIMPDTTDKDYYCAMCNAAWPF